MVFAHVCLGPVELYSVFAGPPKPKKPVPTKPLKKAVQKSGQKPHQTSGQELSEKLTEKVRPVDLQIFTLTLKWSLLFLSLTFLLFGQNLAPSTRIWTKIVLLFLPASRTVLNPPGAPKNLRKTTCLETNMFRKPNNNDYGDLSIHVVFVFVAGLCNAEPGMSGRTTPLEFLGTSPAVLSI